MLENFHFNKIEYLLLLTLVFFIALICNKKKFNNNYLDLHKYSKLASKENLKYLIKIANNNLHKKSNILIFLFLSLIILSLAQPRWKYKEINAEKSFNNVIILIDSSNSMNVTDIAPTRYKYAKENIKDIINNVENIRASIIAFTEIPYLISPLTSDKEALINKITNLELDNFSIQGSNINEALKKALEQFKKLDLNNKNIIILSDGDFTENIEAKILSKIKKENINLFIEAIGTKYGGPIFKNGEKLKINNKEIIAKLNQENIELIANKTNATIIYKSFNNEHLDIYSNHFKKINSENTNFKSKIWSEAFFIFLIPAMVIYAYLMRKITFLLLLISLYSFDSYALNLKNNSQIAEEYFQKEEFAEAARIYNNKYNKAVSHYKNKNFTEAIKNFEIIKNKNLKTKYNLGNSYFMNKEYEKAIKQYKDILDAHPSHKETKHNLDLAEKLLKKNKQKENKNNKKNNEEKKKDDKKNKKENKKIEQLKNMIKNTPHNLQKEKIKNIEKKEKYKTLNQKPW